jgi:hypothetical protein
MPLQRKMDADLFPLEKEIYLRHVLRQMPRLLSRIDREKPSKTYGSFDRTHWSWKFTDFPGSRFQEGIYALSWFYSTQHENNPYYNNKLVFEWILAGFKYWQKLQHGDGSFDEAYPFERSLAATSFTSFYIGEAFLLIESELASPFAAEIISTFSKAGNWLCHNDEHHGVLSNHLAVAAAALEIISRITKKTEYSLRAQHFIGRILSHQSSEGWYEEYGGADFGYQTHGTFYLARYWQLTQNVELLESLKRANAFLSCFVHPNGTMGGEYGSRNTSFYFPAGFEILSSACPNAAAIAQFMRNSVEKQNATGLDMMDAYNFCPLLNNYLFAADNMASAPVATYPLPYMKDQADYRFPEAGLLVHVTPLYQAIFAPSKGGVTKIYNKKTATLDYSDCGYWFKSNGKSLSSQSFSLSNRTEYQQGAASVTAPFTVIKQKIMSPWLFILFRLFMLTLGRQKKLALFVKNLLVKTLITGRATSKIGLTRNVVFSPESVIIKDQITGGDAEDIYLDSKFSTIHMGSARYFQPDELYISGSKKITGKQRIFTWKAS